LHIIAMESCYMKTIRSISVLLVLLISAVAMFAQIPAGSHVTVRLSNAISSQTAHTGDSWSGTLAHDVVVNGRPVARAGDRVNGVVSFADKGGRLKTPGRLSIRVTSVNGQQVRTSALSVQGRSHTKQNVAKMGGGAAAGALIGGLAGGGKGALIGTLAGGAAGTGAAYATNKAPAVIGAESLHTFTVTGSSRSGSRR
jgi:hypothetical protein